MKKIALGLCGVLVLLLAADGWAHGFARSVSNWRVQGDGLVVRFSAPLVAAESVPFNNPNLTPAARFEHHLRQTLRVKGCRMVENKARVAGSKIFAQVKFTCVRLDPLHIRLDSFFDADPSHVHFARFFSGKQTKEHIFSDHARTTEINLQEVAEGGASISASGTLFSYGALGVRHILEGLDHLAFLFALLLVCGWSRGLLWAITGFTLGHSVTLGLASSGWLIANIPMVETLIGWTIVLMALERSGLMQGNLRTLMAWSAGVLLICFGLSFFIYSQLTPLAFLGLIVFSLSWGWLIESEGQAKRLVPILSIGFGLIHGLGFAAVLSEIGLPQNYFLPALIGFNVGVEIGQLLFIACLCCLVWAVYQRAPAWRAYQPRAEQIITSLLVGLGVYWFISRNFL